MSYVSISYYLMIIFAVGLYYIFPKKVRWVILLISSGYFYYSVSNDKKQLIIFVFSIVLSYIAGICIHQSKERNKTKAEIFLVIGIIVPALLMIVLRCSDFLSGSVVDKSIINQMIPVGLSFYFMQIVAYLVDIYRGKIEPQKNVFKYALFISFFPIIIQGPISRYEQLGESLIKGHSYDNERIMRGIQLIIWGFFLKYMIADKAAIVVNMVFDNYQSYSGVYIFIAAVLYSIQLYTDFLSCVTISQGVAGLFGVEVIDNFWHPYFSASIKEFWRRWHISLSEWLRDYVYIPLGESKGEST